MHLRSLSGTVAGAQKQAAKMRAACARKTPRRLRGSSSPTSERLHQQRSRERAKLQFWPAAAVRCMRCACVHLLSLSACTLARKGKPSKCARLIRAGIAIICAAPSNSSIAQMLPAPHRVTQPRASEAAALPGSCGACVHLRSLSACTLARKGKPPKCARHIRADIASFARLQQ